MVSKVIPSYTSKPQDLYHKSTNPKEHTAFIFLDLSYFTLYNILQFHHLTCEILCSYSWIEFHCVCAWHFHHPFISWWTLGLLRLIFLSNSLKCCSTTHVKEVTATPVCITHHGSEMLICCLADDCTSKVLLYFIWPWELQMKAVVLWIKALFSICKHVYKFFQRIKKCIKFNKWG